MSAQTESEPTPTMALGAFVSWWLEGHRRRVRRSTADQYTSLIRARLLPHGIARVPLAELRRAHCVRLLHDLTRQGYEAHTVRAVLSTLRRALMDALDLELIAINPAVGLSRRITPLCRRGVPVPPDDAWALWTALRATHPLAARVACVQQQTALRISEVLGLQVGDLGTVRTKDGPSPVLHLRRQWDSRRHEAVELKSASAARTVHLTATALAILRSPSGLLWIFDTGEGRPVSAKVIQAAWRKVRSRLDMPRGHKLHGLRHLSATQLVQADVNPRFVQQMLGHADPSMTHHYSRFAIPPRPDGLDEALALPRHPPVPAVRPPGRGLRLVRRKV